ncbi:glycine receptor subunit alphaZ1-like isoform X3 [Centruroides sculpturatus]|uniref:glycine receptor subunit alphaZ1-like isoform X3 n=1 Tax=Centruroides sculpturatus TaxID=218467 RepID=UPI000C6DDDF7|nr:glycine receptor subunit alphaZ1-like isoform X3 [Centruroides sculpturatus]
MYNVELDRSWMNIIPTDYDNYAPPLVDGKPVTIYINLEIMDVDEIREQTMDFRMFFFLNAYWTDPRLKLEVLNLTLSKILPPSADDTLWVPDLMFDNTKWGYLFQYSIPNTFILITKDLIFRKSTRYSFRVACPMDLHRYPLDIQDCVFKIGLLKNTAEKVRLEWCDVDSSPCKYLGPSIALMEDIQPLKHEMKVPKPRSKIEVWTTGNYSYLYAKFTFIRRLTDVNAVPARVTLGVTSLLTIITQMLQSRSYTPPVDYVKAVDIWLLACMFFVTASLIEYAFALQSVEFKEKVSLNVLVI